MSIMLDRPRTEASTLTVEDVRQFLYHEARFLGRQGVGELAGTLCGGCGVLGAVLGR
jgi:hypothetical protein